MAFINTIDSTIERFEPHGIRTYDNDNGINDKIEAAMKLFTKRLNTYMKKNVPHYEMWMGAKHILYKHKYIGTIDQTHNGVQNIDLWDYKDYTKKTEVLDLTGDDNKVEKYVVGDPGGYCLAWSMWFLNLRLEFAEIPARKLIVLIKEQMSKNQNDEQKNDPDKPAMQLWHEFIRGQGRFMMNAIKKNLKLSRTEMLHLIYAGYKLDSKGKVVKDRTADGDPTEEANKNFIDASLKAWTQIEALFTEYCNDLEKQQDSDYDVIDDDNSEQSFVEFDSEDDEIVQPPTKKSKQAVDEEKKEEDTEDKLKKMFEGSAPPPISDYKPPPLPDGVRSPPISDYKPPPLPDGVRSWLKKKKEEEENKAIEEEKNKKQDYIEISDTEVIVVSSSDDEDDGAKRLKSRTQWTDTRIQTELMHVQDHVDAYRGFSKHNVKTGAFGISEGKGMRSFGCRARKRKGKGPVCGRMCRTTFPYCWTHTKHKFGVVPTRNQSGLISHRYIKKNETICSLSAIEDDKDKDPKFVGINDDSLKKINTYNSNQCTIGRYAETTDDESKVNCRLSVRVVEHFNVEKNGTEQVEFVVLKATRDIGPGERIYTYTKD
jgi:hypothetical protein